MVAWPGQPIVHNSKSTKTKNMKLDLMNIKQVKNGIFQCLCCKEKITK
jgi:hypothetical protein